MDVGITMNVEGWDENVVKLCCPPAALDLEMAAESSSALAFAAGLAHVEEVLRSGGPPRRFQPVSGCVPGASSVLGRAQGGAGMATVGDAMLVD